MKKRLIGNDLINYDQPRPFLSKWEIRITLWSIMAFAGGWIALQASAIFA